MPVFIFPFRTEILNMKKAFLSRNLIRSEQLQHLSTIHLNGAMTEFKFSSFERDIISFEIHVLDVQNKDIGNLVSKVFVLKRKYM